jgi:hypothetical protein
MVQPDALQGTSAVLLQSLMQAGTAAVSALQQNASSSSSAVCLLQVTPVVQQLLSPGVSGAGSSWAPSWALEACAHALLSAAVQPQAPAGDAANAADAPSSSAAGSSDGAAAAQQLRDGWRLEQAADTLQQLQPVITDAAAGSSLWPDAALQAYMHAMAAFQGVLQVRPESVVAFMADSSDSGSAYAAALACLALPAAVASLKRLSAALLLPADLVGPLAKTATELCLAAAAAAQQQQQPGEGVSACVRGVLSLLLAPDEQLRLQAAAAFAQACLPGVSISISSGCCAVFEGVALRLLQQQGLCAKHLLPAYQAVAQVMPRLLSTNSQGSKAAAHQQAGSSTQQVAAAIVAVLVQQLCSLLQPLNSAGGSERPPLQPADTEKVLLQLLLLRHILARTKQAPKATQQPKQQQGKAAAAASSSSMSRAEMAAMRQLLPQELQQQLQAALLQALALVLPAVQQDDGGSNSSSSSSWLPHKVTGSGGAKPGPGGFPGYQCLLSPCPTILTWGASGDAYQRWLGQPTGPDGTAAAVASGSGGSGGGGPLSTLLLDPYLDGSGARVRLMQQLPLQLAAAAVDLTHTLLPYGLAKAVGGSGAAAAAQQQHASSAASWVRALCTAVDLPALRPVRKLSKEVLSELAGGSSDCKQARAVHHLRSHTSRLLQALQLQGASNGNAPGSLVEAAAASLDGDWQRQCGVHHALLQLLPLAEGQLVCWASVCSSSPSQQQQQAFGQPVLPLLLQLALQAKCVPAIKLVNAALTGAIKASSSSTPGSSSNSSSSARAPGSAPSSSSCGGGGGGATKAASKLPISLDLSWLVVSEQQQQQPAVPAATQQPLLSAFITRCVLGWPESKERKEAAKALVLLHKALGVAGNAAGQAQLLQVVLRLLPAAGPAAGVASLQLIATAGQLVKSLGHLGSKEVATSAGRKLWHAVSVAAGQLFASAAAAGTVLAAHPCAAAYQQLQAVVDMQLPGGGGGAPGGAGYYLEVCAPDVAAGRLSRKPPSNAVRLDSIAAELKFGDKQVCVSVAWGCTCAGCPVLGCGGSASALPAWWCRLFVCSPSAPRLTLAACPTR